MPSFRNLLEAVDSYEKLIIQTHDFPDHDALASAYGLKKLLELNHKNPRIIYSGTIIRGDLKEFIENLAIPAEKAGDVELSDGDGIIIVDGCAGNKNITALPGAVRAVIDHHIPTGDSTHSYPHVDIRPGYGSCSTIIGSYYHEQNQDVPADVATAFLSGLYVDTSFLTRGLSPWDIQLFTRCYPIADMEYVSLHVRNKMQSTDLPYFRFILEHLTIADLCCFCYFPHGCEQNLMGILADFCLSIQEVRFVLLMARNNEGYSLSVRSEKPEWAADEILREVIEPYGYGGGHTHMAGGYIKGLHTISSDLIKKRLFSVIRGEIPLSAP